MTVVVTDVSRQKRARIKDLSPDTTVLEFLEEIVGRLELPRTDPSGRPQVYQVLVEREGRHLQGDERLGDVLKEDDLLILHPNIEAGI